ncbi:hypothetical protein B0H19DRAFT_1324058 [Mycena capillaripes]|nr:hypothetical protein B0H19DRAFT_1324058 [Mycena capillaripes]
MADTVFISQPSPETCGNNADLVPLFQLYDTASTTHFYTTDDSRVTAAIHQAAVCPFNGVAALIFSTLETSMVPFLALINELATAFFLTTSATERSNALASGYSESDFPSPGYIYPTQVCGSVPLYRTHFVGAHGDADYLYTVSAADRDNAIVNQGFINEGIAGYVMELASGKQYGARIPFAAR